jgi:hypothetical protein
MMLLKTLVKLFEHIIQHRFRSITCYAALNSFLLRTFAAAMMEAFQLPVDTDRSTRMQTRENARRRVFSVRCALSQLHRSPHAAFHGAFCAPGPVVHQGSGGFLSRAACLDELRTV